MQNRRGGEILIDTLIANNVSKIFGVPGESYLDALDALYDRQDAVSFITCRQEGGAAFMADAYANATGKIGVCFVTRGPGASNASIGLHTAFQGSTPLLLLIGQAPRNQMEREAFQEINYKEMFGPVTKWVAQIDQVERIPEFINRAISTAINGRPGPVALALPEDVLVKSAAVKDLPAASIYRAAPRPEDIARLGEMLKAAKRPLIIVGGANWTNKGRQAVQDFAGRNHLPVASAFRRQDRFDNLHPCYIGNLGFGSFASVTNYVKQADLVIGLGARLADATVSKYSLIKAPKPDQTLVHILPAPEELGRVLVPDLGICADVNLVAQALAANIKIEAPVWQEKTRELAAQRQKNMSPGPQSGPVDMGKVMRYLAKRLPEDAIITNGAGNFANWPNKIYAYRAPNTTLAPISGAMGYGVPASVAAKIAFGDRVVLCFAGDGDFLMNGQEVATAVQYKVNPIILVINNSSFGTIRMHQEKHYPGRISGTDLENPDFAALGRAYGGNGVKVTTTEDFEPAFEAALASNLPSILEICVGPTSFGPDMSVKRQLE